MMWFDGDFREDGVLTVDGEFLEEVSQGLVYETLRTYNRLPFAAWKHYERWNRSLSFFGLTAPITFERYMKILSEGIEKLEGEVRMKVYFSLKSHKVLVVFQPLPRANVEEGVSVKFARYRRIPDLSTPPFLKITGRTDIVLARRDIKDCYDVLIIGASGQLCEGSFSNVFLVKDGVLVTPSLESGILDGITRENVIELAKSLDITVEERIVQAWEVFTADEVFLTHTSMGVVPVRKVEDRILFEEEAGPITKTLMENFEPFALNRKENWVGVL